MAVRLDVNGVAHGVESKEQPSTQQQGYNSIDIGVWAVNLGQQVDQARAVV